MKVGDKIELVDAGEAEVTAIHEDTGRLECKLADGRTTVAWPDAVKGEKSASTSGKAALTVNGKAV